MKGINNQIKDCRKIYTNTHHLMERNKIMEDFKDYLDKLLIQKEDLRSKMKNFVEKL